MRLFGLLTSLVLLGACAGGQQNGGAAPPPPEAVRGRAFAEDSCASCHAIEPGAASSPNALAPSFQTIADTPGMTRIAFGAWLHSAHENMPQLIVDQDQADDVWAYLSSLEGGRE